MIRCFLPGCLSPSIPGCMVMVPAGVTSPPLRTLLFPNNFSSLGLCPWVAVTLPEQVCCLLKGTRDKSEMLYSSVRNTDTSNTPMVLKTQISSFTESITSSGISIPKHYRGRYFFMWSDCTYGIKIFNSNFRFLNLLFQKVVLLKHHFKRKPQSFIVDHFNLISLLLL